MALEYFNICWNSHHGTQPPRARGDVAAGVKIVEPHRQNELSNTRADQLFLFECLVERNEEIFILYKPYRPVSAMTALAGGSTDENEKDE